MPNDERVEYADALLKWDANKRPSVSYEELKSGLLNLRTAYDDLVQRQTEARREERERIAVWLEMWAESYEGLPRIGGAIAGTLESMAGDLRQNWLDVPDGGIN